MSKITMAAAFGAGYVLGARAGRDRYREIRAKATSLWQSDAVQTQAAKAREVAKEQGVKVQEAARDRLPAQLGGKSEERPSSGQDDPTASRSPQPPKHSSQGMNDGSDDDRKLGTVNAPGTTQ